MIPDSTTPTLLHLVRRRCPPSALDWLDGVLAELQPPLDRRRFATVYAGARRRLGDAPVTWDAAEGDPLEDAELPVLSDRGALAALLADLNGRGLDEVFRVALWRHATQCLPAPEHPAFIDETYRRGDNHERQALLRALAWLPDPPRFLATAVEACRSSVQTVFEAIARDNPYPHRHFPEPVFNQMVLKALFTGAPLGRVRGLRDRVTPDLTRMVADYAQERRAAGRPVPPDAALILLTKGAGNEAV